MSIGFIRPFQGREETLRRLFNLFQCVIWIKKGRERIPGLKDRNRFDLDQCELQFAGTPSPVEPGWKLETAPLAVLLAQNTPGEPRRQIAELPH